jgi:hypothetical protein
LAAIEAPIDARQGERLLGRLRDRIAAGDPAFSRLRLASRGLLSLLLSCALLAGITFLIHPLPVAAYGLTLIIAFNASLAVRDPTAAGQLTTRLIALPAAVGAVSLGGLVAGTPLIADATFLTVIFIAVYVRKFGQRWFAVGLMTFMSYFMGDYLRAQLADIGWLTLAAVLALGVTHFVATVVLRDDAERDFRRALVTIDRRINLILRYLLDPDRHGGPAAIDRRPVQKHLARLRDTVLMAEGFIPQGEEGSLAAAGAASDVAVALFELQLVVERMARASYLALPPDELVRAVLYHDGPAVERVVEGLRAAPPAEEVASRLLLRVHQARVRLDAALGPHPSAAFVASPPRPKPPAANAPDAATGWHVPTEFQLPIQVTLACAIALSVGLIVSPMRWYWAVITAFIVFNNTKSRADTAMRSLQRSAGTFAGLIGGTAVATLLHGQLLLSGAAIPVLLFVAIYFVQTSYGTMIFFLTIALALLYGVTGTFTPELLLLRLEETVIGALAGTLVAFLVFPARASNAAAAALDKYLTALGDLVAAARRRAHGEPEPLHLLARSRLLDRAYTDLAAAARPLGGRWNAVTRFGEVRERLLLLTGCAHWGRVLARSLRRGEPPPPAIVVRIDVLADEVAARIAHASAIRDTFFERPEVAESMAAPRPPLPITESEDPAFALEVISALLGRAALDAGSRPA